MPLPHPSNPKNNILSHISKTFFWYFYHSKTYRVQQDPVTEREENSENLDKSEITTGEFNSSFLIVGE